jgi:hypothetical protein
VLWLKCLVCCAAFGPLCCCSQHRGSSQGGTPGVDQHPQDLGEQLGRTTSSTGISHRSAGRTLCRALRSSVHASAKAQLPLKPWSASLALRRLPAHQLLADRHLLRACVCMCRSSICLSTWLRARV